MSEENLGEAGKNEPRETEQEEPSPVKPRRRCFTRRKIGISSGALAIGLLLFAIITVVLYRYGVFDNYIREQFRAKMDRIGMVFNADVFRVTVSPLKLELKNATFSDKLTGDSLFRIDNAELYLTVKELYAWQLSRDVSIDTTDVDGIEVWVKFDEQGRSNFSNLVLVDEKDRVNVTYSSTRFTLKNGVVHIGDVRRKLAADAKNLVFSLEPEDYAVPDEEKRFKFDVNSTDSFLTYGEGRLEDIDIRARGVADKNGAEISELRISTPIGDSTLTGRMTGWDSPRYDLTIDSTVDLTQASGIFPLGTPLRGIGNFSGKVSGQGEAYRIDGRITSESLSASNIYLRGLDVTAALDGRNSAYEANGKAVAQLLTFEDFKIDYPQILGTVRGTGTDFRWFGELQAAAAKTRIGTIGGLFISDAVADYKERKFGAAFGNVRARSFVDEDLIITDIRTRNVKADSAGGVTDVTVPGAQAGNLRNKVIELNGITTGTVKVTDRPADVVIRTDRVGAENGRLKDAVLRDLSAEDINIRHRNKVTDIDAATARAEQVDAAGARIGGILASGVTVRDTPDEMLILSDGVKVASVTSDAAVLGQLNIAGVRLTVRRGRVEGSTGDIDAGNVALVKSETLPDGGSLEDVNLVKPVFVLEPSGRYRVTADMSLGGGVLGSVRLGSARAAVAVTNDQVALNDMTARIMEGSLTGNATIAFDDREQSELSFRFEDLDVSKLLTLKGGRIIPIEGQTTGTADLTFSGTNIRTASGTLNADITASAGSSDRGLVPVSGRVELTATNGFFNVDVGQLTTGKSVFNASGVFDLNGNDSNLTLKLGSSDAHEIDRIIRVLDLSPDLTTQIDSYQAEFAGNLNFDGKLTGDISDPTVDGTFNVDALTLRGQKLGSIESGIFQSPAGFELRKGILREPDGGTLAFDVKIPKGGTNNVEVTARLDRVNTGNILAALPFALPETLRGLEADTSGSLRLTGLPNAMEGEANLSAANGSLKGESFDSLDTRLTFAGTAVNLEKLEARFGTGFLRANGTYRTDSKAFDFTVTGSGVEFARVRPFIPGNDKIPGITGTVDLTARATGRTDDSRTYDFNFEGKGRRVTINESPLGEVAFTGRTEDRELKVVVNTNFEGQRQEIRAKVDFKDENLPFEAETEFRNAELAPYIAMVRPAGDVSITGLATGRIFLKGNLTVIDKDGQRVFSTDGLSGSANFMSLGLQIDQTPLVALEPVEVLFALNAISFKSARFAGGGSNITITGTKALTDDGINNLSIVGRINLNLLNALSNNTFFAGLADVNVGLTGPNSTARLNGSAELQSSSVSTFVGSERVTFERIVGRVIFTSNQLQIDESEVQIGDRRERGGLVGFLGGGRVVASGGALLSNNLRIQALRFDLRGNNVTVPLPKNFLTTGDVEIGINGRRIDDEMNTFVSGRISAQRSLYTRNIDLADVVGGRQDTSLSQSSSDTSALGIVRLDLVIEGRDALVVRNNLADLTASLSLRVTGDIDTPQVAGRITANSGTIFFRSDRYDVQRVELVFPPNTAIEPVINLQAESEINGYQILVNLSGSLTDTESLNASVRSNPALPQADVISLITTGNLANTETGIPTIAQSGISTAAEILTDEIINKPVVKATDKLFGLNRFELDPIISGQRLNPTARLTVGRQINRNLLVTYSTNLSEDQNQVLALEYRVSNRLSFVAQYEQRSLSNVTQKNNNFSFEIRLRKRF